MFRRDSATPDDSPKSAACGETLEQTRKSVNLDEFQKSSAGDSRMRNETFVSYVMGAAAPLILDGSAVGTRRK